MKRLRHRRIQWILGGLVLLLGLAACSGGATITAPEVVPTPDVLEVETDTVSPAAGVHTDEIGEAGSTSGNAPPADPAGSPAPVATEPGEAPETEQVAPAPVKEGLEATDPGTVQLASGEVQLVEFFAFW